MLMGGGEGCVCQGESGSELVSSRNCLAKFDEISSLELKSIGFLIISTMKFMCNVETGSNLDYWTTHATAASFSARWSLDQMQNFSYIGCFHS